MHELIIRPETYMSELKTLPDAEQQIAALAEQLKPVFVNAPETVLIGVFTGGVWIAERLSQHLPMHPPVGSVDISFYRDDFSERGLSPNVQPTTVPVDIVGKPVILVDDVLYTGRTTRAALNELFDYGRPASVKLAVLADRGERQLPIAPDFCVWQVSLPSKASLVLTRTPTDDPQGHLTWSLDDA